MGLVRSLPLATSLGPQLPKPEAHQGLGAAVSPEAGHGWDWGCRQGWGHSGTPEGTGWVSGRLWSRVELTSLPAVSAEPEQELESEQSKSRLGRACAAVGGGGDTGWEGAPPPQGLALQIADPCKIGSPCSLPVPSCF